MVIPKLPDAFAIRDLVDEYESNRLNKSILEVESKVTTIRFPLEDLSILQAIADFYGETRQSVVIDFLHTSAMQFFQSLPSSVRSNIADRADKILVSELKNQYKESGGDFEMVGSHWSALAEIIDRGANNNG
jgi:polyhydroxyalkanoate synthesis regulator protein